MLTLVCIDLKISLYSDDDTFIYSFILLFLFNTDIE